MEKKTLNKALRKIHPHCTIEALAKMTGITMITLYEVNANADHNLTKNNMEKIYKATKLYYGKGLSPWEYLNVSNWATGEMMEENLADRTNIPNLGPETLVKLTN